MKVAFIGTRGVPASYSGFETCVENVGARMVESGHEVVVFCRSRHYACHLREHRGMRLCYLPSVRRKHLETLSHTALSALRLPRSAAVVCMGVGNAPVVRWLELNGRQTVFNVDGADWERDKWSGFASRYLRYCEHIAAGSRSILIADAIAVQTSYSRRFARETELVSYGGEPPNATGDATLAEFGLVSRRYILFVGRLVPENAPHDCLAAISMAEIDVPAVIVGDASYADSYIATLKAQAPPGAVFTGYQFGPAYQQLTAHAGMFVLAATVGGTHPVLVEQMAAGNCILARNTESNREVLGDAGVLWRTPVELASNLRRLWRNPDDRQRLSDAARARAAARYRWDDVTKAYLDLCERSLRPN